ncbi:MAG: hypothetical protein PVF47_01600 [Anaerolineae bacterium]|jgi:hypothetical protein
MAHKFKLRSVTNWPRWSVVPVGLSLAGFAVFLGLLLEPAGYALSPAQATPTPTIPVVDYGRTLSDGCHDCHFSLSALQASAEDPSYAETFLIDPHSVRTPHGSLGCVACHSGQGEATDKETGHRGLIADISQSHPEQCIICHQDLPSMIPGDELLIPHDLVENQILHGEPESLFCSDCHGAVGHGFDPTSGEVACPMMVCVDCHARQEPCMTCHQGGDIEAQMTGCDVCHEGLHDVTDSLACPCCHTSVETWQAIDASSHPVELPGRHGEIDCFECHTWPNFRGLNYICPDCHESGHTDWGGEECTQCHDPGATWDIVAETWDKHQDFWEMYKGDHRQVECQGCHFETYTGLDPNCDTCHELPETHETIWTECWLCH